MRFSKALADLKTALDYLFALSVTGSWAYKTWSWFTKSR